MIVRRACFHLVILLYLTVTACALLFTLTRSIMPPIGRPAVIVSFAMMAPFQGYATHVAELSAEGMLSDGSRVDIDMQRYNPLPYGERLTRGYFGMFRNMHGEDELLIAYQRLAQLITDHERLRGNPIELTRLYWSAWPVSPDGLFALRKPPALTQVPVSPNPQ
jgi:hypothetical protein